MSNLKTIDDVIEYIRKFRESHLPEYFLCMREHTKTRNPYLVRNTDAIQGIVDLYYNLEEHLNPLIPEEIPSPKSLFRSVNYFHIFAKKIISLVEGILENEYSDGEPEIPSEITDLHKIANECLDFSEYVLEQECVKITLGQFLKREKDQRLKILDSPTLIDEDLKTAFGKLGGSIIFFDIDHFKTFNTKYTENAMNNSAFAEFQRILIELTDQHGYVYAKGGDEFIILLSNFSKEMAISFAENLRTMIENHQFEVSGDIINFTVSIGVSHDQKYDPTNNLIQKANDAENIAKNKGRNMVIVDNP